MPVVQNLESQMSTLNINKTIAMKKIQYISSVLALMCLSSCAIEDPFPAGSTGQGQFSKKALNLEVTADEFITTRTSSEDELKGFKIVFTPTDSKNTQVVYDDYAEMPNIVTLNTGNYTITASKGDNQEADFEKPYYVGTSNSFEIKENEITTNIGIIKCQLQNIKVTIKYHDLLVNHMDIESTHVEVKINEDGTPLKFTKIHSDNETAGYFKHKNECTLVATFKGIVDGVELNEVKTLRDVSPGNHYKITFTRHEYNGEDSGDVDGSLGVDASVTTENKNTNVIIDEDKLLDDNERPGNNQSGNEDPSDPSDPNDPSDPGNDDDPSDNKPTIEAVANPETGKYDIILDQRSDVHSDSYVSLKINCPEGFKVFNVTISDNFDLGGILPNNLDLINPDNEDLPALRDLDILGEDDDSLKDKTEAVFNVTPFMSILCESGSFANQEYVFTIYIEDNKGNPIEKKLIIYPIYEGQ